MIRDPTGPLLTGAFFGLIGAVAIYHLLMYAVLRAPEFLSYGVYLVALAVFQYARVPSHDAGTAAMLFWWSFAAVAFLGYWLFRTFLALPREQRQLDRIFFGLTVVVAVAALVRGAGATWLAMPIELIATAILVAGATAIGVAWRHKLRVATFFGVAYLGFFLLAMVHLAWLHVGDGLGVLAPVGAYGIEIGVAFQALTLALGLADRIAVANEERDRARRRTIEEISTLNVAYARFVPRAFLDLLGKHDVRDVQLGDGIEREMTVLFSDVRSFTTLSEAMTPNETFGFINALLSRTGPVVREHGGTVDKYVGDAIMALFPGSTDDALRAGIGIQHAVAALNAERTARGQAPIAVGVGLHRGSLMLGTIGEEERMDGTVIADAVNVASRVEGLTKQFGARVLITESVRAALRDPDAYAMRDLGHVPVKGKVAEVAIYEVLLDEPAPREPADAAANEAGR